MGANQGRVGGMEAGDGGGGDDMMAGGDGFGVTSQGLAAVGMGGPVPQGVLGALTGTSAVDTPPPGAEDQQWSAEYGDLDRYRDDPLLPDVDDISEYLELLQMLRTPMGQRVLGQLARKTFQTDSLMCFSDIEVFRSIPSAQYRRTVAQSLFGKYVKQGGTMELGLLNAEEIEELEAILEAAKTEASVLEPSFFHVLHERCFQAIFHNTFIQFKQDEDAVKEFRETIDKLYNKVFITDFDYFEKLGEGAFGRVVHVRKKSTGIHYAMKIQSKKGLLKNCNYDADKLLHERMVLEKTAHAYILGLDYALHTDRYVIIVTPLVTAGTLQDAIDEAPLHRLPEERCCFYTAELVLALNHLHGMGLMYRDLKPRNVLLNEDGHVLLADMGAVADFDGDVLTTKVRKKDSKLTRAFVGPIADDDLDEEPPAQRHSAGAGTGINASDDDPAAQAAADTGRLSEQDEPRPSRTHRHRMRKSIMGTRGYMAPEMVRLMGQPHEKRKGYTAAVDFWSLGVTSYKMITGGRPFPPVRSQGNRLGRSTARKELEVILNTDVDYPSFISPSARGFIEGCLTVDQSQRLGSGVLGCAAVLNHPWFEDIDWDQLSQRRMPPPFRPHPPQLPEVALFTSFNHMMSQLDFEEDLTGRAKRHRWDERIPDRDQEFFSRWDYVSPRTIRIEAGLAEAQEGPKDGGFKVRQMMGVDDQPARRGVVSRVLGKDS